MELKKEPSIGGPPAPALLPINLQTSAPRVVFASRTVIIQRLGGSIMGEGFLTDTRLAPNRTVYSR